VVIADLDRAGDEATQAAVHGFGGEDLFVECDVARAISANQMVQTVVINFNRLDILVNNAGILFTGTVVDTSETDWNRLIAVNLTSAFLCSKYAIPQMIAQGGGVILNVASTAGLTGGNRRAAYSASKGGMIALTRSMALDQAANGIRDNCLCPGLVDTPMLRQMTTPEGIDEICRTTPLGRLATPSEVVSVALSLVSDNASYVTGVVWTVDGGESLV